MSKPISSDPGERGSGIGLEGSPRLLHVLDGIREELDSRGELGLLSVTTLGRTVHDPCDSWVGFEQTLTAIHDFLRLFIRRNLRRTDVLLEPVVAGNTLAILIGPPREARSLNRNDLTAVRHRVSKGLKRHLRRSLPPEVVQRYGVYVGCSLMRSEPSVDSDRIIYRAVDEAFVDALGQRTREGVRQAFHLRRILHRGHVHAVYQPLVDVVDRRVIGFEALTRPPAALFRSPEILFKVAHDNGAVWALERLCRRIALKRLPTLSSGQKLFLNLEPESFHDPDLRKPDFLDALAGAGLGPRQIVLELTERAAVTDFGALRATIEKVRSVGFQLAMDDVGSGHASLQAIAEIRPDYLKVDMSLVRDLHLDSVKRALISTILSFSHATGITLVAEGVETRRELDSLIDVGVRCAQGYLFARPSSPPTVPDWALLVGSRR